MIYPVFHIPHDGTLFPEELMDSVCIPMDRFLRYHELMRDRDVRKLVPVRYREERHCVCFPVSRLLCDVERFIGPREIMERYGMGYCYERAYDGQRIKNVTAEVLTRTRRYYERHHQRLDRLCRRRDNVVLIDLHSFSDALVPKEFLISGRDTPDVCIGTDPVYSDPMLASAAERVFQTAGFSTDLDYPYSGCLIPNHVLSGSYRGRFRGIMLEVNRRICFEGEGNTSDGRLSLLRELVGRLVERWGGM